METKTKFIDSFSEETYGLNYQFYTDRHIDDTHNRVASGLAAAEDKPEQWTDQFCEVLRDFKFVPGGRITSNAGTQLTGTTMINCFVSAPGGEYQDSMEGILRELKHQALILKSEGGYGFCADFIRPRGSFIHAIANESPGAVRMLDMWDTQSAVITSGSGQKKKHKQGKNKIRKGAQMVTMSCWHPDIEEFITAKKTPGRLTKFNMSVLVTDKLMEAAENGEPWQLEFPDYGASPEVKKKYNEIWDGNIEGWKAAGLPVQTYKTYDNANELLDLIMKSTYNRNEPGVLFVDTINRMNNLYYEEFINATNPCGEQVLPPGGVCLLGSLNLTQFVDFDNKDWDYDKLAEAIPVAIRMMDNVNDCTLVPLEVQKWNLQNKRRIGLGYLGYGSALMMLKVKYGSTKALKLTEKLGRFVANTAYKASALLAKEKGAFPLYDEQKYLNSEFVKTLDKDTQDLIRKYGVRNSHILSIQPTGNSSVFANNVSGGLEPLFMTDYVRTAMWPSPPEGLACPTNIDWVNKTYDCDGTDWDWAKEGDENILVAKYDGFVWKFDQSRGLLRETQVKDYAVRFLEGRGEWDPQAEWAQTTTQLSIDEHVDTMEVFSRYVDSAMSKTVNLPNDYPYQDFKQLYYKVWKTGTIKGCTTYRAGTMTAVLSASSTADSAGDSAKITKNSAPKRPETLPCEVHHMTYKGKKWIAIVGLLEGDPYEVFAFKSKKLELPSHLKNGKLTKVKGGKYDLSFDDGMIIKDVASHFAKDEEEVITRMISSNLRHGADIEIVVDQLLKAEGTVVSFSKVIARCLKKYIKEIRVMKCPECGSRKIVMAEGCFKCGDCGYSKCE